MNLAQALKQKNRICGELNRLKQIFQRENARRSDSTSKVNQAEVFEKINQLTEQLVNLKAKIATANVGIYKDIEMMSEIKSTIAYINNLHKQTGEEVSFVGRDNEKLVYTWTSYIDQEKCDAMAAKLQKNIEEIQDRIDTYNYTTILPD